MMFWMRPTSKRRSMLLCCFTFLVVRTMLFVVHFYKEEVARNKKPVRLRAGGELTPVDTFTTEDANVQWSEDDFPKPQRKRLIIYWSGVRGHKVPVQKTGINHSHFWPFFYAGKPGECPVPCELSSDQSRAAEASAFVVHARPPDIYNLPPIENLAPWILQTNENPVYTPAMHDPKILSQFNLLVSYRLDSDFPAPIYPMPELTPPVPFHKRLGNVLAIFSKCEPVRTEYMRQLMNYIQVDSYGACLKNKEGLIGLYGKIDNRYVFKDHKLILSKYYKFSLVFMNQDCDYFIDDRLYHALTTGSVPVFMGTEKVDKFLPGNLKNSIIKVSDFKSPKELAEYLRFLGNNETAYSKYLEWKWKGMGDIFNTTIGRWWQPRYPLFCQVCMALAKGKLHRGLKLDYCQPRRFEDWGLESPDIGLTDKYSWFIYVAFVVFIVALLML
ncbi:4-galactosyl-N-acetylglucosaminide 3-alpha-L-fucosyltransferase 9-like [Montipora foliosa]|uniref:4-galactosyl-N-acetylglucosaminide 3-alpha-L-fucosyltransferase 9-like n=1 Tax=Montipora foliosa TaxID=591990 RepID=UPI0035F1563A